MSIIVDEKNTTNKSYQWLFHINNFYHKHVILPTDSMITNVCEEEWYMYLLRPTRFINDQDDPYMM